MNNRKAFMLVFFCLISTSIAIQSTFAVDPGTPRSQKDLWVPPKGLTFRPLQLPESVPPPPDLLNRINDLTLADLIDLALVNNMQTRESWYLARSAEAEVGQEKADYYPQVDL